jgi:elongation factor G
MKAIIWLEETLGAKYEVVDVPEEYREKAEEWRAKMVEAIVEHDDELMMKYLEGEEIPVSDLKRVLRKATIEKKLVSVLCGSAFKNRCSAS